MKFEELRLKTSRIFKKHGIDFADVAEMFKHPMLLTRDDRVGYGEDRWLGIGWLTALVAVVVYTERHGNVIRVISARKATKQEAKRYVESIGN